MKVGRLVILTIAILGLVASLHRIFNGAPLDSVWYGLFSSVILF